MNKYLDKTCPYCKSKFVEGDDIVECSACEMPHHKDCWIDNRGCTTFGCQGTIQGIDFAEDTSQAPRYEVRDMGPGLNVPPVQGQYAQAQGQTQYAQAQGQTQYAQPQVPPVQGQYAPQGQAAPQAQVLPVQGQYAPQGQTQYVQAQVPPVQGQYAPQGQTQAQTQVPPVQGQYAPQGQAAPQAPIVTNVDPEVRKYLVKNEEYYLREFDKLDTDTSLVSWNWCAFLFGPYWLLYRGMLKEGIVGCLIVLLTQLFPVSFFNFFALQFFVVCGLLGNAYYYWNLKIVANKDKTMLEPMRSEFINKNSADKTSYVIIAVIAVLFIALLV